MTTGKSKSGKVAAGALLGLLLCVPAFGQHRDRQEQRTQQQSSRREVPRPPRQERSFPRQSVRTERPYGGGFPARPVGSQPARPAYVPQREGMGREVAHPPAQTERRVATPSYAQGQPREVPRPPVPGQSRGAAPSFAQQERRNAQPPAAAPQRNESRAAQGRDVPRPPQAGTQAREVPRPPAVGQKHGGDWLRAHRDLPLADQQKALQNDPQFRKLPPQQQQRLVNRLHTFNSLSPQEQQQRLNRVEVWEHLTPQQKQQARQLNSQWKQLSPERRKMMKTAIGDLRAMPPEQRESVLESDRFKGMFSDQERTMLRETTKLPLAPAEASVPRPPQD
jgi:hypothetical protein